MGAMIVSDRVAEPFLASGEAFAHGLTFGGHPVAAAVALANLDVIEREDLLGHVRRHEPDLRATLEALHDIPDRRATSAAPATSGASSSSPTRRTRERVLAPRPRTSSPTRVLGPALRRRGLICRAADRGYPVIQLAPPLIAGPVEFAEIGAVLREVLEPEAAAR